MHWKNKLFELTIALGEEPHWKYLLSLSSPYSKSEKEGIYSAFESPSSHKIKKVKLSLPKSAFSMKNASLSPEKENKSKIPQRSN